MKKTNINELAYEDKVLFFAMAKRATVGQIGQIVDGNIVNFYVGKLRGMIVTGTDGQYKFGQREDAMACAKEFRSMAREKATEMGLSI